MRVNRWSIIRRGLAEWISRNILFSVNQSRQDATVDGTPDRCQDKQLLPSEVKVTDKETVVWQILYMVMWWVIFLPFEPKSWRLANTPQRGEDPCQRKKGRYIQRHETLILPPTIYPAHQPYRESPETCQAWLHLAWWLFGNSLMCYNAHWHIQNSVYQRNLGVVSILLAYVTDRLFVY